MLRKLLPLLLVAALFVSCSAPAATPAPTETTLTDVLGRSVVITKVPEKIITTTAAATEIVYALGAGDKLVGRDEYSTYPEEALSVEVIGDYAGPNIERVTALAPDIVVMGDKLQSQSIDALAALGLTVLASDATGYDDVANSITLIAKAILPADQAQKKADEVIATMTDAEKKVADAVADKGTPKVYYSVAYGEYGDYTCGKGSYITRLIELAGGVCVSADVEVPWPSTSIEQIITWDPDVIVLGGYPGDDEVFKTLDNYKELRAVKDGRVYLIDANVMSHPGPRLAEALLELGKAIHPDAGL